MLDIEVLVVEFLAIYRLSSSAIECCEVTALYHERFDHSVEDRACPLISACNEPPSEAADRTFEAQQLPLLAHTFLTCGQGAKVLGCLRDDYLTVSALLCV